MKPVKKLYAFHHANLKAVTSALDHVSVSARMAIGKGEASAVSTHVRLLCFLLGVWSEVRLLKLLHEPLAFTDVERSRITAANALDRWLLMVETAFRKHYGIPRADLRPPKLPSTAYLYLTTLRSTLKDEFGAIITLRNKLAHGQWCYPLNESLDDVAQTQMDALRTETVLSLSQKRKLLDTLCKVIHDLAVSKTTFERDWDKHFRCFEQTRTNIEKKSYVKWEMQVRARYSRGRQKRRAAVG